MRRNLRGKRIVITRARHQAEELAGPLRDLGAELILLPLIGIAPPDDPAALISAASQASEYDWIIFTSVNAITAFVAEMPDSGEWFRPRVATIGPATRDVAEAYGLRVDLMPEKYVAEALSQAFRPHPMHGKRVLIPSAAKARDVVPSELRARGAIVDIVTAYRNVIPAEAYTQADHIFQDPLPDWITFASSSAVEHFLAVAKAEILDEVRTASIGPATSATLREHQLPVSVEAAEHNIPGLIDALLQHR